jgi:hypothetical protein
MSPEDVLRLGSYLSLKDIEEDEQLAAEHIQAGWPVPHISAMDQDPSKAELHSLIQEYRDLSIGEASGDEDASSPVAA